MTDQTPAQQALEYIVTCSKDHTLPHKKLNDCVDVVRAALQPQPIDLDALHSKIDMDVEDAIGREITMEESRLIGTALKAAHAHICRQPSFNVEKVREALEWCQCALRVKVKPEVHLSKDGKNNTMTAQDIYDCADEALAELDKVALP